MDSSVCLCVCVCSLHFYFGALLRISSCWTGFPFIHVAIRQSHHAPLFLVHCPQLLLQCCVCADIATSLCVSEFFLAALIFNFPPLIILMKRFLCPSLAIILDVGRWDGFPSCSVF